MKSKSTIPYNKPFIAGKELEYIYQAVRTNAHVSGDGPFTKKCQNWLEHTLGVHKALITNSCTAALEMAALLCDIGPGDEVIMPSFTFVSTANAFVLRGGVPTFVDIRPDTLNLDENLIEAAITDRTKAIVPVHYAGFPCAMDKIMDIARAHGLRVIEDAAQALLSTYKGKHLGAIGDIGCMSFHETKNIISGEGGALFVNDPELSARAEIIWEKGTNRKKFFRGQVDKYTWVDFGSSYLPSDIISAFLYGQLEVADEIISNRSKLFCYYSDRLQELENKGFFRLPKKVSNHNPNGHIMYVIARSPQERAYLLEHFKTNGVDAVFHYVPLHSSPMGKNYCRVNGSMHTTDAISDCLVRLPLFYGMKNSQIDNVVELLYNFFQ